MTYNNTTPSDQICQGAQPIDLKEKAPSPEGRIKPEFRADLDTLLSWARAGAMILPGLEKKQPRQGFSFEQASGDEEQIRKWHADPSNKCFLCRTGKPRGASVGFFAVDLDDYKPEFEPGEYPLEPACKTTRAGRLRLAVASTTYTGQPSGWNLSQAVRTT